MQVMECLGQHLEHWAFSPAYPELVHLPLLRLRRLVKTLKVERFRAALRSLVTAVESQAALVTQHRSGLACAPTDAAAITAFMTHACVREKVRAAFDLT